MILAASGDVGGGRVLQAVLEKLSGHGVPIVLVNNGYLGDQLPHLKFKPTRVIENSLDHIRQHIKSNPVVLYMFTTSVQDTLPLELARLTQEQSIFTMCLLDSWMNYRSRLEIDAKPALIPDLYTMMDEHAKKQAIQEGFPESILKVTGHPALAGLADEWSCFQTKHPPLKTHPKKRIVLVFEPVASDQGTSPANAQYRGYTEEGVFIHFCQEMQAYADRFIIDLLPHPRQDAQRISDLWCEHRRGLEGGLLKTPSGREAVFHADGVCGMASILLYESWLLGKPVLTLQPGLCRPELAWIQNKQGTFNITQTSQMPEIFSAWIDAILFSKPPAKITSEELHLHRDAPENTSRLVLKVLSQAENSGHSLKA